LERRLALVAGDYNIISVFRNFAKENKPSLDFRFVHVFGVSLVSLCNDKCPFFFFKNYQ
jgi:hypothetical protein